MIHDRRRRRRRPSEAREDQHERQQQEAEENRTLHHVGPGCGPHTSEARVEQRDPDDAEPAGPVGDRALRHAFEGHRRPDYRRHHVGYGVDREEEEQEQADHPRVEPAGVELGRRHGTQSDGHAAGRDPDQKKRQRSAPGHDGRVQPEHADAVVIGASRDPDKNERRGVGSEECHEQHERPEPTSGEEVVFRRSRGAPRGQQSHGEDQHHVNREADHHESDLRAHGSRSSCHTQRTTNRT